MKVRGSTKSAASSSIHTANLMLTAEQIHDLACVVEFSAANSRRETVWRPARRGTVIMITPSAPKERAGRLTSFAKRTQVRSQERPLRLVHLLSTRLTRSP
jgi:hypothetical protein